MPEPKLAALATQWQNFFMGLAKEQAASFLACLNIIAFVGWCGLALLSAAMGISDAGYIDRDQVEIINSQGGRGSIPQRSMEAALAQSFQRISDAEQARFQKDRQKEARWSSIKTAALYVPGTLLLAPLAYMVLVNGVLRWLFTGHFSLRFGHPQGRYVASLRRALL